MWKFLQVVRQSDAENKQSLACLWYLKLFSNDISDKIDKIIIYPSKFSCYVFLEHYPLYSLDRHTFSVRQN